MKHFKKSSRRFTSWITCLFQSNNYQLSRDVIFITKKFEEKTDEELWAIYQKGNKKDNRDDKYIVAYHLLRERNYKI